MVIRREGAPVILEPVKPREWPDRFFDDLRANAHMFADLEVAPANLIREFRRVPGLVVEEWK